MLGGTDAQRSQGEDPSATPAQLGPHRLTPSAWGRGRRRPTKKETAPTLRGLEQRRRPRALPTAVSDLQHARAQTRVLGPGRSRGRRPCAPTARGQEGPGARPKEQAPSLRPEPRSLPEPRSRPCRGSERKCAASFRPGQHETGRGIERGRGLR